MLSALPVDQFPVDVDLLQIFPFARFKNSQFGAQAVDLHFDLAEFIGGGVGEAVGVFVGVHEQRPAAKEGGEVREFGLGLEFAEVPTVIFALDQHVSDALVVEKQFGMNAGGPHAVDFMRAGIARQRRRGFLHANRTIRAELTTALHHGEMN
jgi:hypothetical protein